LGEGDNHSPTTISPGIKGIKGEAMGRKSRKQARKIRRKKIPNETDKLAKELAILISKLPPREHQNDKVLVEGRLGCIPFGRLSGYAYCKDCWGRKFCMKEVRWIIKDDVFIRR